MVRCAPWSVLRNDATAAFGSDVSGALLHATYHDLAELEEHIGVVERAAEA